MYTVLLADDERPALNYLRAIFQKYLPDFQVLELAGSAGEAIARMEETPVDVLVTDISMPGMNGIDLAKWARDNSPQTHTVIVSGFAEFEFARGAIQAGVDDYLLKPVGIPRVRDIMQTIQAKLDAEYADLREDALSRLIACEQVDERTLRRCFGEGLYRFAILRQGNLAASRHIRLRGASFRAMGQAGWLALYGHDEQETIFLREGAARQGRFADELTALAAEHCPAGTPYTAIYEIEDRPLTELPAFLDRAFAVMNSAVVVGRTQCLPINAALPAAPTADISTAVKKQLTSFVDSGNTKMLKELFISLSIEWEQAALPQLRAESLCYQLISHCMDIGTPSLRKKRDQVMQDIAELYASASSYGDLLASVYSLLFEEGFIRDQSVTAEELCEYTLSYIRENYAQPLNIQRICTDVGISQTYLSRLLRKYADTTFNTYLTQCRMAAAKEMLRKHPDILLHDVATCVGYDDQSYFSKIFRSETGMTPKQYAASVAGGEGQA